MKQAILDTDTISYFFRGNEAVVDKIDEYLIIHGFINISVISYYEVLNGLYYKDAKKQLKGFLKFVELNNIVALTQQSAKISAEIRSELKKSGKIIGHNDVLIAGIAIENDFTLVTNNVKHFSRIKSLDIDTWSI